MSLGDIRPLVIHFERVLRVRVPPQMEEASVAAALREIFAVKCALAVLKCVEKSFPCALKAAFLSPTKHDEPLAFISMPNPSVIEKSAPSLLRAVEIQDADGAIAAIRQMEILSICPSIAEPPLDRLELRVRNVSGRQRLIPLIELAFFAVEVGSYDRAGRYIQEAHSLYPESPERHDLSTLTGLVNLIEGKVGEARLDLIESVLVCQENDYARLMCGARSFNLQLGSELLQRGENEVVVEYLSECKKVWVYEASRIESWIGAIKNGSDPDFFAPSIRKALDSSASKLHDRIIRSSFLREMPDDPDAGRVEFQH